MPEPKKYLFEGQYRTSKEVAQIYTARGHDFCRRALQDGLTTIAEFNVRESKNTAIANAGGRAAAQTLRKVMHNAIQGKQNGQ